MLLASKIPFRYIFGKAKVELVYVMAIGLLVHGVTYIFNDFIPEMPISIPVFLGTAISVILSFKLNQSYDRWWEARKIWGSIVNDSRSFVLQLQMFIKKGNENQIRKMAFRQMAWCYSLGQSLRGINPTQGLDSYLEPEEIDHIEGHKNKPLAILQLNTKSIAELKDGGQLDVFAQVQINNTLVAFSNSMGMAERIKSTVFPATYTYFLHLIIYLFVVTLSIALRDIQSYFEIPLLMVISMAFFLLEKTATHLQDPFSNRPTDTPMTAIANTIEINLKQLIQEQPVPEPHKPTDFYLM